MDLRNNTFVRFIIVGIINTLVGMSIMFLLFNIFGCSYWISSAANYIVGSIVSYILNSNFTFHSSQKQWKSVIKFTVNILICYLIAYGIAKPVILYTMDGVNSRSQGNIALLLGAILFVILNYTGQKLFVFKK